MDHPRPPKPGAERCQAAASLGGDHSTPLAQSAKADHSQSLLSERRPDAAEPRVSDGAKTDETCQFKNPVSKSLTPHQSGLFLFVAQADPDSVSWALNAFGYNSKKKETRPRIPEASPRTRKNRGFRNVADSPPPTRSPHSPCGRHGLPLRLPVLRTPVLRVGGSCR